MAKFLILNSPPSPVPKTSRVAGCVNYFLEQVARQKAVVHPVVGTRGYATLLDAGSNEDVLAFLKGNPMAHIERYEVFALADLDFAEQQVLGKVEEMR